MALESSLQEMLLATNYWKALSHIQNCAANRGTVGRRPDKSMSLPSAFAV